MKLQLKMTEICSELRERQQKGSGEERWEIFDVDAADMRGDESMMILRQMKIERRQEIVKISGIWFDMRFKWKFTMKGGGLEMEIRWSFEIAGTMKDKKWERYDRLKGKQSPTVALEGAERRAQSVVDR